MYSNRKISVAIAVIDSNDAGAVRTLRANGNSLDHRSESRSGGVNLSKGIDALSINSCLSLRSGRPRREHVHKANHAGMEKTEIEESASIGKWGSPLLTSLNHDTRGILDVIREDGDWIWNREAFVGGSRQECWIVVNIIEVGDHIQDAAVEDDDVPIGAMGKGDGVSLNNSDIVGEELQHIPRSWGSINTSWNTVAAINLPVGCASDSQQAEKNNNCNLHRGLGQESSAIRKKKKKKDWEGRRK